MQINVRISIHAPRGGSDSQPCSVKDLVKSISIHAPRGGSDFPHSRFCEKTWISIHAPRGGSDSCTQLTNQIKVNFNPRSPWGERPTLWAYRIFILGISIHAPRGGSDCPKISKGICIINFNPRSPWGERPAQYLSRGDIVLFQSTLPVGGATSNTASSGISGSFQSTLPVGGATKIGMTRRLDPMISIHAPRGGSDRAKCMFAIFATISIHAPRGGSDCCNFDRKSISVYFNPRSPWGERLMKRSRVVVVAIFQSTLLVGGATAYGMDASTAYQISIHAPRGGSDSYSSNILSAQAHFNPRSPWGERPAIKLLNLLLITFQSTLPVGGATSNQRQKSTDIAISIHAPRGGSDRQPAKPHVKI